MDKKKFLESQKIATEQLLRLSGQHPVMGPAFRARLEAITEELRTVRETVAKVTTSLFFNGGPVVGSMGISADFVSRVMAPFSNMVKTQYSALKHGRVADRGPRRGEHEADLLLTGLPRGSFGLELSPPEPTELFQGEQVSVAMLQMTKLVEAAAQNDEAFAAALAETPRRVLPDLQKFLSTVADDNASVRLVTADLEVSLGQAAVVIARDRAMGAVTVDEVVNIEGRFRGATLNSWRFDFSQIDGTNLTGRIAAEVPEDTVGRMNLEFTNKDAIAELKVIRVTTRTGVTRTRYELLDLKPIAPPAGAGAAS